MSLESRLDDLENYHGKPSAREDLIEAGIAPERATELVGEDGLKVGEMTDEELEILAPDDLGEVFPGGPDWNDLTDDQLRKIANGADPRDVVG